MRAAIRSVKMFSSLSDADCDDLVRFMKLRQFAAGQVVFERGAPGDTLLVVTDGSLSVRVQGAAKKDVEVARIGAGEVVGEMSCVDPSPRSATVVALAATTVYEFGRDGLAEMRRMAPGAAVALVGAVVQDVTRRLREVDERIERQLGGGKAAAAVTAAPATAGEASGGEKEGGGWRGFLGRLRGGG